MYFCISYMNFMQRSRNYYDLLYSHAKKAPLLVYTYMYIVDVL